MAQHGLEMYPGSKTQIVVRGFLDNIFKCKQSVKRLIWRTQAKKNFLIFRKGAFRCPTGSPFVVKTIRLHHQHVSSWIADKTDYKIVHLVRDPRSIFSSMKREPIYWRHILRDVTKLCNVMENDLKLRELLPSERYTFVRYEDLVEDTERRLESLFHFMEIPFTDYIREVAFNQTHTEERKGYFSSFRGSGFVHDSWRKKLSKEDILWVENQCGSLMEKTNYSRVADWQTNSTVNKAT